MRTHETKSFACFAKRWKLDDDDLIGVVRRADQGLIDADLGGGVIKQCVARVGSGRASGFRTIILFRKCDLAFFVYGFAKWDRTNLRPDELMAFRMLANEYLDLEEEGLKALQSNGTIIEVKSAG